MFHFLIIYNSAGSEIQIYYLIRIHEETFELNESRRDETHDVGFYL